MTVTKEQLTERCRINQSTFRARRRDLGYAIINKWIPVEIREMMYAIIDRVNHDFKLQDTNFLKMMNDILSSPAGTKIHGIKRDNKWHFHVIHPSN